jgi:aminoglycoside phosphotransferase (APT) family kinase protein
VSIDPHAIAGQLGLDEPLTVELLAANRGKGVWRVRNPAGTWALRVLRPHEHDSARRELAGMDAARRGGVEVPEVVASATWEDRPVLLLSWCRGEQLRHAVRARPWSAFRLGAACGRQQAALHALEAPSAIDAPPWISQFGPVDEELQAALTGVAADPKLLHLDLHAGNVLVEGGRVRAVLDWTNVGAGDPRADLARSWSLLLPRARGGNLRARASRALDRALVAGWRSGYAAVAGPPRDMAVFEAWALTVLVQTFAREGRDPAVQRQLAERLAVARRRAGLGPVPVDRG